MTAPSDHSSDREAEPRSAATKDAEHSQAKRGDAVRASATSWGTGLRPVAGGHSDAGRLEEIEARLSDLAERESDLRRREEEIAEQQRLMEQYAQRVARQEGEQQRATIEEALKALAGREAAYNQRRAEVRHALAEKIDLIRQRKHEFVEKVQTARVELKRRKLILAREQRALDERAATLQDQRAAVKQQAADLAQRAREIEARTSSLERCRRELERATAELDERGKALAAQEAELVGRRRELDTRETAQQDQYQELDDRARELEQRAATLRAEAAELEERGRTLAAQETELADRRRALDAQETETQARAGEVADEARELEQRAATLRAATAELDECGKVLAAQETELASQRRELDAREAQLQARAGEVHARARDVEQRDRALGVTAAELSERARVLEVREADLEERGSELDARDADLQSRAAKLHAQALEIEGRAETWKAALAQLDERARIVAAEETELARRRGELDTEQGRLQSRHDERRVRLRELDQRAATLEERAAEVDERAAALNARETELDGRGAALDARAQELAQDAAALDARDVELDDVRRWLESQGAALQDREERLNARAQQLAARERDLGSRAADIEAEAEPLQLQAAEAESLRAETAARLAELETDRAELEERARALEQRSEELDAREAELDESHGRTGETQADLARQREEITNRQRALDEQQAALSEQARQLEERERALSARVATGEPAGDEAARREAEIEERRVAVDKLYQQAFETKEHAQRQQEELAALQGQLRAREAELRRESLQIEVDRQRVQHDSAMLAAERDRLAELWATVEDVEPRPPGAAAADAVRSIPMASVWRRGVALCSVAGLAAALIWFALDRPRYRSFAEIQITSERGSPEWIASQHAEWLESDALAQHWQGPPPVATWMVARANQRVSVRPRAEGGAVRLTLETADKSLAETLLPAAVKTHVAYVGGLPLEQFHSPLLTEWSERRAALSDELARRCDRRDELQARLAQLPAPSARDEAQTSLETALDEFKGIAARLREQREQLTALASQELPRGEVTPKAYQQALADDALYQEDLKEFASEARQYQTELAVSMVLLVDPLQQLRKLVQALVTTITEQRDMQPPPNVRTVLEECLVEADDYQRFLAEFSQAWDRRRETIERLELPEEVVELADQQNVAVDATRRLLTESQRVLREIRTRVDSLTETGDSGTREIVVASVLRGSLSRLSDQLTALEESAGATDVAVNFRLDAHGRQLAGVRTRLMDRQQRIREMLQEETDRAARAEYDEQERRLREGAGELEERQRALVDTLIAELGRRGELDTRHQELRALSTELRAEEASITRLEERLAELEAQRPVAQRDAIELVESRHEQVAGAHRLRNAALAGTGAFGATAFLLLCMFIGVSRRQGAALKPAGRDGGAGDQHAAGSEPADPPEE